MSHKLILFRIRGLILEPFKFSVIKRNYDLQPKMRTVRYLDIGCGNHSASLTHKYIPNVEYWGVDKGVYNNQNDDFKAMYRFIDFDLEKEVLFEIADSYFDIIVFSHVLEHLHNYSDVLLKLLP